MMKIQFTLWTCVLLLLATSGCVVAQEGRPGFLQPSVSSHQKEEEEDSQQPGKFAPNTKPQWLRQSKAYNVPNQKSILADASPLPPKRKILNHEVADQVARSLETHEKAALHHEPQTATNRPPAMIRHDPQLRENTAVVPPLAFGQTKQDPKTLLATSSASSSFVDQSLLKQRLEQALEEWKAATHTSTPQEKERIQTMLQQKMKLWENRNNLLNVGI
mmetsp:Transcript_11275/g.23073  ORF Transcript_11275/g.23073 Transcript_11275/m.23073 type:complete len:218 (-) Transcript_11275:133-786(-)